MISTQTYLSLDCSGINWMIYYPPFDCSNRNGWKIPLSVNCTTVKKEPIHTISYKLHQQIPHSILVLMIQFMLLLYICSLSNKFLDFTTYHYHILFSVQSLFFSFTRKDQQRTMLARVVTYILSQDCGTSSIRWLANKL